MNRKTMNSLGYFKFVKFFVNFITLVENFCDQYVIYLVNATVYNVHMVCITEYYHLLL